MMTSITPQPTAAIDAASVALKARYRAILANENPAFLNRSADPSGNLSNLFLVSGPRDPTARRVLVVGREFGGRGWRVPYDGLDVDEYVALAIEHHRTRFQRSLRAPARAGTFFHLIKRLAYRLGDGGLIYSNLFCCDHAGRDPGASAHFLDVKRISQQMLDAQIECLQPEIIVFANGKDSVDIRREFFPIAGPSQSCCGTRNWMDEGIPQDHLWEFELRGRYRCYRIHHPSARSSMAATARRRLVKVLAEVLS